MVDKIGTRNNIYIVTNLKVGNKTIQNAVHRWGIPDVKIVNADVLNNYVYLLDELGGLYRIDLQEPSNIITKRYIDESLEGTGEYNSSIIFSKFYYRDQTKIGLYTGRTQIRVIEYAISRESHYQTRIYNTERFDATPEGVLGPRWDDELRWEDEYEWLDEIPYYYRIYKDDSKISVLGNTDTTRIIFEVNEDYKDKGFAITTYNMEYLLKQRANYRI
jgi:hypothetical protein